MSIIDTFNQFHVELPNIPSVWSIGFRKADCSVVEVREHNPRVMALIRYIVIFYGDEDWPSASEWLVPGTVTQVDDYGERW